MPDQIPLRRLSVLQVLECGGPGGTGNQVAALCNALDPSRFDVGLVYACRESDAEAYRLLARGASQAWFLPEMTREISPARDIRAFVRLYRIFKERRPDVVHAHSSKAGVLARVAARVAGVPKIFYSPHGYGFLQKDRSPSARALYKLIERACSSIGTIVAVSPSERALAEQFVGPGRVELVADPYIGPETPAALIPHDGIVFGACGRLTPARDPDSFVLLAQQLTDSRNGLHCLWIGGGELEPRVRLHMESMNLRGKLEITGWLAQEDVLERMRGLDVFVHYSAWDALPNAVLEAMAAGLPVVASNAAGCRDAVVDGETGFIANNEIELLERCLLLADDAALRRKMGLAGQARAREMFSQKNAVAALGRLYLS